MKRSKFYVFLLVLVVSLTSVVFADTLKSGSRGPEVLKLQTQLKTLGYFDVIPTGHFGSITKDAVKKFQADKGLAVDGIFGPRTKAAINSIGTSSRSLTSRKENKTENKVPDQGIEAAAKEAQIEVLDWWTQANEVFARGSNAKVIDVRTGRSFYIKRTYGGNHADCETLTKDDTKIMKEIWGGTFSWSRRPVIIEINGRRLAASMAGMPHAGLDNKTVNATVSGRSGGYGRGTNLDTVKNNGMDGHFDVHFKNSRTHGSNRVDPAHQNAIKEAAGAKL